MNQLATLFMVASGSLRHRLSGVLLTIASVAMFMAANLIEQLDRKRWT